ncbi:M15 family metallopeptidase [Pleomorphomonas oryzae]|uniref:M15 family metallopeptidase n=1 Tax=Pleomorphomonas oryzae TaxID=261934 RepID=UPI000405CFD2|nr:M15 family metallopeptidase [Pleomorphomonas oryzae]
MSNFVLGVRSRDRLVGVHPSLVMVVERAIELTEQDFTVLDGVRSLARQKVLKAQGKSKTMLSKHLRQSDGFGHAVDIAPVVNGSVVWSFEKIRPIVLAMRLASIEKKVTITWGSIWDRNLAQLPDTLPGIADAVEAYKARHPGPDFLDGPHYQLA